jgi:transcription antitermination factor NusG
LENTQHTHENHLDTNEARWFAVYTSYKREKIVHAMLNQKGIHSYLPLQKVTRRYTRKIKTLELPLISCYLFVKITKSEYVPVLETDHVLKFIRFSKNLIAIPEEEINTLKKVVGEGIEIEVEPLSYKKGDEVEIIAGNLTGMRGKLVSVEGKKRVLIDLEHLGYSLRIAIDSKLLKKLQRAGN